MLRTALRASPTSRPLTNTLTRNFCTTTATYTDIISIDLGTTNSCVAMMEVRKFYLYNNIYNIIEDIILFLIFHIHRNQLLPNNNFCFSYSSSYINTLICHLVHYPRAYYQQLYFFHRMFQSFFFVLPLLPLPMVHFYKIQLLLIVAVLMIIDLLPI